ncbi:MAG: hypothetical protein AAF840_07915, partial [Bacteroidota bacterium]
YNLIAYYQYLDFIKSLDEDYNESLTRMQEHLLVSWNFSKEEPLKIPTEDLVTVRNYLNQKRLYVRNYLVHRKNCQNINNTIRQQIKTEFGGND